MPFAWDGRGAGVLVVAAYNSWLGLIAQVLFVCGLGGGCSERV
jgi:hypothetical protein